MINFHPIVCIRLESDKSPSRRIVRSLKSLFISLKTLIILIFTVFIDLDSYSFTSIQKNPIDSRDEPRCSLSGTPDTAAFPLLVQ